MTSREDYIDQCLDPSKRRLDRNRGIQIRGFAEALERAAAESKSNETHESRPNKALATPDDATDPHCPKNFD